MTTLDPGASVVFTHGLAVRPRSTALRASSAAPIMTCGLDVLVHDVMEAMRGAPWAGSKLAVSVEHGVGWCGRPLACIEGGSEAGKLASDSWSTPSSST